MERLVPFSLFCDSAPNKMDQGRKAIKKNLAPCTLHLEPGLFMYTAAELIKVQAAIVALAEGTRVVSVSVNGKTIEYGPADIKSLQTLRDAMQAEINSASTATRRYVLTSTEKGL